MSTRNLINKVRVPEGKSGLWKIERFEISELEARVSRLRALYSSQGTRIAVKPGTYTRLVHQHRGIIMSDTPAEQHDILPVVTQAYGNCLINGLGLGMVVDSLLQKSGVRSITVIEIDEDVIALSGPTYTKDRRVKIIHADAFDFSPPTGTRYNSVWHDIWDTICTDNLPEMVRLKRKYRYRSFWQRCWCEDECRRYKRRGVLD